MPSDLAPPIVANNPLARVGRLTIGALEYMGGLALLAGSATRAAVRTTGPAPPFGRAVRRQLGWLFGMGLPLVALSHVGFGSFLAMQAFYGATFVQAVGPVVGNGLFRNLAPLMSGFVMAGLLATRIIPELRGRSLVGIDDDPQLVPDRDVARGVQPDPRPPVEPARVAAVRVVAAAIAGPIFALCGASVGTLVGALVARKFLGVSFAVFFDHFLRMFWHRDVVGIVGKGSLFALVAALIATFEGLRTPADSRADAVRWATFRAICLSILAMLLINNAWFMLIYYAGRPFGPTVLRPPGH